MEKKNQVIENIKICEKSLYSYNTIKGFGFASHIDENGGLVIYLNEPAGTDGSTIIMRINDVGDLVFIYDYDLSDDQKAEITDLVDWITD